MQLCACASMHTDCGSDKGRERKGEGLSNMTSNSVSVSLQYNE